VIQEIEDILFEFYYEMWEKDTSVFSAIVPMIDRLPWEKILSIGDRDPIRQWFRLALIDDEGSGEIRKRVKRRGKGRKGAAYPSYPRL
jgi:hypothetical protein